MQQRVPGRRAVSSEPDSESSDLVRFRQLTNLQSCVKTLLQPTSLTVPAICHSIDITARFLKHLPNHSRINASDTATHQHSSSYCFSFINFTNLLDEEVQSFLQINDKPNIINISEVLVALFGQSLESTIGIIGNWVQCRTQTFISSKLNKFNHLNDI